MNNETCIKLTEDFLKEYKQLKAYVKDLEAKKQRILEENKDISAIRYDTPRVQTSNTNSPVEMEVMRRYEKTISIIAEIDNTNELINKIDRALHNLDEIHRRVIELYVIDNNNWNYVSNILKYDEKVLRSKKKEAVKSIAAELFGMIIFRDEDNKTLFDLI